MRQAETRVRASPRTPPTGSQGSGTQVQRSTRAVSSLRKIFLAQILEKHRLALARMQKPREQFLRIHPYNHSPRHSPDRTSARSKLPAAHCPSRVLPDCQPNSAPGPSCQTRPSAPRSARSAAYPERDTCVEGKRSNISVGLALG